MKKEEFIMRKKFLIGIALILVIIVGVVIFNRYRNKENYDGDIASFEYSFGGYPDEYWDYKIYTENSKTYLLGKGLNGADLNINKEVDNSVLSDISNIIEKNKIYEWNGFYKKSNILDGYTFSLRIKYSDGKEVQAYGHEKYPTNYEEIHEILLNYLKSIK